MTDLNLPDFPDSERFTVHQRLGSGSFGVVYRVFDHKRKAEVALKTLLRADATWIYRMKQEFRSLLDVAHPNLASLYELGVEQDRWYMTMELVRGVDLLNYVRGGIEDTSDVPTLVDPAKIAEWRASHTASAATVNVELIRQAFYQLTLGIAAIHAAGKLHRDVKPSNVLAEPAGRIVLLDYGLVTSENGKERETGGTPVYMAPEQENGYPERASDWYSVGVMLYEALTGRLPRGSRRDSSAAPSPVELDPRIPHELSLVAMDLLEPNPAKRPGAERLLATFGQNSGAGAAMTGVPFVGRSAELAILQSGLETSRRAGLVCVRIQGDSGIGKSALVARFVDRAEAEERRTVVLQGRCFDRESVPYKALDGVVDSLSQFLSGLDEREAAQYLPLDIPSLSRLFPVLGRLKNVTSAQRRESNATDAVETRRRGALALREMLARIAEARRCIVFIDDLQWGDVESVALLEALVQEPDSPALLLIAGHRSREMGTNHVLRALAGALDCGRDCRVVSLGELNAEDARELTEELIGRSAAAAETHRMVEGARGNPFLIDAMLRRGSIADQMARLPEPARQLVELLAVAARPVPLEMVSGIPGMSVDPATLTLLRAERLLRSRAAGSAEEIETYHDRIREPVATALPGERLRVFHMMLARAWSTRAGADAETIALHYHAAGETEKAGVYGAAAAKQAAEALAFDRATRLYRVALEGSLKEADRLELKTRLGESLMYSGLAGEAARVWNDAAAGAPRSERLELLRRAAEQFLVAGLVDEGARVLDEVLETVGLRRPKSDRWAIWSFLWRHAYLGVRGLGFRARTPDSIPAARRFVIDACATAVQGLMMIDIAAALDFQSRHMMMALAAGDPGRLGQALSFEICTVGIAAPSKRIEQIREMAGRLIGPLNDPYLSHVLTYGTGMSEFGACRWRAAINLMLSANQHRPARDKQWIVGASLCCQMVTFAMVQTGELTELREQFPVLLREARENGNLLQDVFLRLTAFPVVHLADGEPERARREIGQAIAQWTQRGFQLPHYWSLHWEAESYLYEGEAGQARQVVEEMWPKLEGSLITKVAHLRFFAFHLRARTAIAVAACGELAALADAAAFGRKLRKERAPLAVAFATLIGAAIANLEGRRSAAAEQLQIAETAFGSLDMELYAAAAALTRGRLNNDKVLVEEMERCLAERTIKDPSRFAAMFIPGF